MPLSPGRRCTASSLLFSLVFHQQLHHRINRRQSLAAGQIVVVAKNGKHKPPAFFRLPITRKRIHVAERTRLGMNQTGGGRALKTVSQRSVYTAYRQRFLKRRSPRLPRRVDQQLHRRGGRDQVAARKSRAVEKSKLIFFKTGLPQKLLHRLAPALKRSSGAAQLA